MAEQWIFRLWQLPWLRQDLTMLHDEPFGRPVGLSSSLLVPRLSLTLPLSSTGNLAARAFGQQYNLDNTTDPLESTAILEEEETDSELASRGVAHALLPRAVATNSTTNTTLPITNTTTPSPRQRIEMLSWPPAPAGELKIRRQ